MVSPIKLYILPLSIKDKSSIIERKLQQISMSYSMSMSYSLGENTRLLL